MKRVILGLVTAFLVLGFAFAVSADQHADKMDCDAMFKKAERMLGEDEEASTEQKVKMYGMAVKGYEMCQKGQKDKKAMKEAEDFFKRVFDKSGRM